MLTVTGLDVQGHGAPSPVPAAVPATYNELLRGIAEDHGVRTLIDYWRWNDSTGVCGLTIASAHERPRPRTLRIPSAGAARPAWCGHRNGYCPD